LLAVDFARDSNLFIALRTATALAAAVAMSVFFRVCATQRRELNRQMRSFTFSEARSFSEEDRTMLHLVISVTYQGGAGGDSADSLRPRRAGFPADGIARFEQHVRSRMPAVVNRLLGPPSVIPTKLLALFGSVMWLYALDSIASRASLPAALFGGARGQALFLAAYATSEIAFSFGIMPLAATASILLANILYRKRASRGAELAVYAVMSLAPCAVFSGGSVLCDALFLQLPNAPCIAANLVVLGVALALTTVRRPHRGQLDAGGAEGLLRPASALQPARTCAATSMNYRLSTSCISVCNNAICVDKLAAHHEFINDTVSLAVKC
jgi:hypothetical protein